MQLKSTDALSNAHMLPGLYETDHEATAAKHTKNVCYDFYKSLILLVLHPQAVFWSLDLKWLFLKTIGDQIWPKCKVVTKWLNIIHLSFFLSTTMISRKHGNFKSVKSKHGKVVEFLEWNRFIKLYKLLNILLSSNYSRNIFALNSVSIIESKILIISQSQSI